jgi:hypothetical protein
VCAFVLEIMLGGLLYAEVETSLLILKCFWKKRQVFKPCIIIPVLLVPREEDPRIKKESYEMNRYGSSENSKFPSVTP